MAFLLTEEQRALAKTARDFLRERGPVAHLRHLRDTEDASGFSREIWSEFASLGFAGITLPERFGGAGLGLRELGLVMEECGRTLFPSPLFATCVLGASALLLGGSEAQRAALLPRVGSGDCLMALAHEEGTRHAPHSVATRATRAPNGLRIDGEKSFVLDGHVADQLVVVTRTEGGPNDRQGITLLLVDAGLPGIEITRTAMVDSRNAASVTFDAVTVPESSVVGTFGRGADVLDPLLDIGAAALAAEMLGGLQEAFDRTVAYLKTRKQFGVPIGSFQALKHRAAMMFCEVELTKSVVAECLSALDEARPDAPLLVSAAKARAADTFLLVTREAVQMHGGIGVTDDLDIGLFLKRARVAEMAFGGAAYHRDRFGRLQGY